MAIVVVPGAEVSALSDAEFDGVLEVLHVDQVEPDVREAYKATQGSFMAVMKKIGTEPEYIPPVLVPQPTIGERCFRVPTAEENPLNAWSHVCEIRAAAPSSSRLLGRTLAIKDNVSVAGLPTTVGASPFLFSETGKWDISSVDATAVARLLDAGAVIRGTSTCEAFCTSALSFTSFTGNVHNPRLHGHTTGGSSSGSGALVAAHLLGKESEYPTAEIGLGSDQGGSVRLPASYNGIYGLKPTFGLVPYTGAASMSPMVDHLGPLASNLEDIATMLEVMAGYDGLDPRMSPASPLRENIKPYAALLETFRKDIKDESPQDSKRPWKIGILSEAFEAPGLTEDVRTTVLDAARTFFAAAGAEVVEVSVPMHKDGPLIWNASTRPSMATFLLQGRCPGQLSYLPPHLHPETGKWPVGSEAFARLHANSPPATNVLISQITTERLLPPGLEAKAYRLAFALRAAYDAALSEVDVLIAPTTPDVAKAQPEVGKQTTAERLAFAQSITNNTSPFDISGHPALSVPCGFAPPEDRPDIPLPVGMQIIAKHFEDDKVILAAALFEKGRALLGKK